MITIQKIKLNELEQFVNTLDYQNLINKPISLLRVKSYLNNPNAIGEDVVLYMAFEELEMIGYKTIFSDTFIYNNCKIKFGWLSGTWTHESCRRKGISSLLLKEVFYDWDEKLMFTNYAEESKAVYDKSGKFTLLKSIKGYRHYIRFSFKELLPPKSILLKKNIKSLGIIDLFLNFIFNLRFKFFSLKKPEGYKIVELKQWDSESLNFIETFKKKELFLRDQISYDWICKFPWIKTDSETKRISEHYYFSSYSVKFKSNWYKVYAENRQKIVGIFLVTINNKHLKLPYCYSTNEAFPFIKSLIVNICLKENINYLTIYNSELNNIILQQPFFRLTNKRFIQNYFSSKKLLQDFPEISSFEIQSGDGDVVFT